MWMNIGNHLCSPSRPSTVYINYSQHQQKGWEKTELCARTAARIETSESCWTKIDFYNYWVLSFSATKESRQVCYSPVSLAISIVLRRGNDNWQQYTFCQWFLLLSLSNENHIWAELILWNISVKWKKKVCDKHWGPFNIYILPKMKVIRPAGGFWESKVNMREAWAEMKAGLNTSSLLHYHLFSIVYPCSYLWL